MTPDPLQERVARVIEDSEMWREGRYSSLHYADCELRDALAGAVLADLREAGELRTYEQVGWRGEAGTLFSLDDDPEGHADDCADPRLTPVYIVREDNTPKVCEVCGGRGWVLQPGSIQKGEPCPRGCKPEGESQ